MENKYLSSSSIKNNFNILVSVLIMTIISMKLYSIIENSTLNRHWIGIPLLLFFGFSIFQRLFRKEILTLLNVVIITMFSTLAMGILIKVNYLNNLYLKSEEYLVIFTFFCFLIDLAFNLYGNDQIQIKNNEKKEDLFNLFYINTSKIHEIAMLIDNKIMKTIEKQHNLEDITKSDFSLNFNKLGLNNSKENINKKNVFENFDVKTTKSILLRKIYTSIKNNSFNEKKLGDILLFKNIGLNQKNTDDTVMILNVLKDMDMKNISNDDNIELNFSKMINEMLDDFTIDYTFKDNGENYLIRIPYKTKENFENNYSHNDLQLGKLSIIGIYRGKINFSKISSISSKFLEMLSESYNNKADDNESKDSDNLLSSSKSEKLNDPDFKFTGNKLKGDHHLIDLIAIIQEINIQGGE